MSEQALYRLGIDVQARKVGDYNAFIRRLRALKSTARVEEMGEYRNCPEWRQVYVESTMTESELDAWCYRFHDKRHPFLEANAFIWTGDTP